MNYIKGYRYQLWCEAKALGTTSCVVSLQFNSGLWAEADLGCCRYTSGHLSINASRTTKPGYVVGTHNRRSRNRATTSQGNHRQQNRTHKSKQKAPRRPTAPLPPPKTPKNHTPRTCSRTSSSATKNPAPTVAGTNPSSPSPGATLNPPSPRSGPP